MFQLLRRIAETALDILAPARCAGCSALGRLLCEACAGSLLRSDIRRFNAKPDALPVIALADYAGVARSVVIALKFRGARTFGRRTGALFARRTDLRSDVIVPVPLHESRLRERGYNQAAEIGAGIGMVTGARVLDQAIVRIRATQAQSSLLRAERGRNVSHSFGFGPKANALRGRDVLLVDDVLTTGATAAECAAVISRAGSTAIRIAVLAVSGRIV
ncbi:MAG TPA: ComF family protein [Candidatus Eremiobacteraceae bacterium]|nr:ComF family protein [Candidatus Eremiobacteraceae bacterium]